jgi:hypothetical protein
MAQKFTQAQIDSAMAKAVTYFNNNSNQLAIDDLYAMKSRCDFTKTGKVFLFIYALSTWEQDKFGNTEGYYNYMTQQELTDIVSYINQNC